MDVDHNETENPPEHYEYVAECPKEANLKSIVLESMKELQGWCSVEKANILIDLILLTKAENVVEIGVWGGKSLIPMAYAVKANEKGTVYGIDPWSATASADGMDGANFDWWSQVDHEGIYQGLLASIEKFQLQDQIVLIRETSGEANVINDIDLIHIDGNHSDEASYLDVTKWVPQVKRGGIVVFDDVNWSTTGRAVSWLNENCIKIAELRGDNIWGIWIKP